MPLAKIVYLQGWRYKCKNVRIEELSFSYYFSSINNQVKKGGHYSKRVKKNEFQVSGRNENMNLDERERESDPKYVFLGLQALYLWVIHSTFGCCTKKIQLEHFSLTSAKALV